MVLSIFTKLADLIVYQRFGLPEASHWADSLHFFIEDTTKIFALLVVMIYVIAWARAALNIERVRDYLSGKNRLFGYAAAASFGAATPFCSCSSIVGGAFIDLIGAEKHLTPLGVMAHQQTGTQSHDASAPVKMTLRDRHVFARDELKSIFSRVWKWVLLGVGLGAALHGLVPESFVVKHLGAGQWWTVPAATLLGIPLYSNASGVIPVAETLLSKGLPVGTTLAFMMSTVAASFPEFMMLKQVMQYKLLVIFFLLLLVMFTAVGWIFNLIHFQT